MLNLEEKLLFHDKECEYPNNEAMLAISPLGPAAAPWLDKLEQSKSYADDQVRCWLAENFLPSIPHLPSPG